MTAELTVLRKVITMLTVRTRQKYLNYIGINVGKVDGIEGKKTKAGYKKLQDMYFVRKKDRDGEYGKDTDILLVNAYRVKKYTKNFRLEEFKCHCGGKHCTGYPAKLNTQMLKNLQLTRNEFGPVIITYTLRCKRYNATLPGSDPNSKHLTGDATDHSILPLTQSEKGREKVAKYERGLKGVKHVYHNKDNKYPNMGNAIHMNM